MFFDESRLKDPGFFRENRLDAHSDHAVEPAYRLPLNGLWKFAHAVNPAQVIPGFEQPDFDCRGWNDIHVPAHIQLEGWGRPQYCNTEYIPGTGWRISGPANCRRIIIPLPAM